MRINYDFNDLEAFLAVKDTGSFHLAAERLNLSQSAITRRVKKLETALDTQLFERTTRAVKPTLAAKRLQARAEAILDDAAETTRAMRDESVAYAHQRNALVTFAVIPTIVSLLVPKAIGLFRVQGNKARLRLMDHTTNAVAESVANGEADFGICSLPELEPNTEFDPLFDDQIVLACPKTHPLTSKASVTWTDFTDADLIVPARGTGNRLLIDEAMAHAGIPLQWSFEIRRSTTALDLVAAGVGLALVPKSSVITARDVTIDFVPVVDPKILRPVGLLRRIGQKPTTSDSAFQDVLRQVAKELPPLDTP